MKWSSAKKCPAINEVINEAGRVEMASRPLKKAKYAWQVKKSNENGISTYRFNDNVCPAETSSDDSSEAIIIELMNSAEATADPNKPHLSSSSSFNGPPGMSQRNSVSDIPIQHHETASTSATSTCTMTEPNSENANTTQVGKFDCNANKSNAPDRINFALCRWQSKQLAQGIIDNAINKVLGDLGIPSNHNESITNPTFGEPISWGTYLNAQNIENEGVVEAIRQQGLQHKRFAQQPPGSSRQQSAMQHSRCEKSEETFSSCIDPSTAKLSENVTTNRSNTRLLDATSIRALSKKNSSLIEKDIDLSPLSYNAGILAQNKERKSVLDLQKSDILENMETLMKPEDLLTTAVSYAISEKGLGVLNVNE